MVTKAKRLMVVGLAALLLAGGGTAALNGGNAALAGEGGAIGGGVDAQAQDRERPGEEIPSERGEGPTAQAGQSGGINSGSEF